MISLNYVTNRKCSDFFHLPDFHLDENFLWTTLVEFRKSAISSDLFSVNLHQAPHEGLNSQV